MFSSHLPWDFKLNHPTLISEDKFGPYAFYSYDAFLEKIFLSLIPPHILNGNSWKVINANEVTIDWIEENIVTPNLFSTNDSYRVLLSENLSPKVQDFLLNEKIDWPNIYFFLSFSKENKFFEKLKKKKKFHTLKVLEPRFWEASKLFRFLCEQLGVFFNFDVQNLILEYVPNTPGDFISAIKKLAMMGVTPNKITVEMAKAELVREKFDQFELARLWGEKNLKTFFEILLENPNDYNGLMLLFRFMQGHLLKMLNPNYRLTKKKLTQYDRQIEDHIKLWKFEDLKIGLALFGNLEILAKEKNERLKEELRLELIQTY